jgi:hypothetical protein
MLKNIINNFKSLDRLTFKIMKYGLIFCFIICILSVLILFTYNFSLSSPFMFLIGINLFKISLIFGIEFIVCGFIVDGIKKQLI